MDDFRKNENKLFVLLFFSIAKFIYSLQHMIVNKINKLYVFPFSGIFSFSFLMQGFKLDMQNLFDKVFNLKYSSMLTSINFNVI